MSGQQRVILSATQYVECFLQETVSHAPRVVYDW